MGRPQPGARGKGGWTCEYCGEKCNYICSRCNSCEHCEQCRTPAGDVTGSGWFHRFTFKGAELMAVVLDHKNRGIERKPAQKPST